MRTEHRGAVLLLVVLVGASPLIAQGTTGGLTGNITHQGQPLPGVTITIASPMMQGTRVAYSYVNGDYNFATIPPGDYTISFEMEGMTPQTRTVTVGLARIERVNAAMIVTPVAQAVTVTAAAPTVVETTEVQANFDSKLVENLPIARTIQETVLLAPGVKANAPGQNLFAISGASIRDNLVLLNGAVASEGTTGVMQNFFVEDAIQETSVLVGSISAEYGRFIGGVVSTITKSGGNEFSGSLRDSFSNPAWTDSSAYGEPGADSTLDETYEATLGGRIVRDRLWFFTAGRYAQLTFPGYYTNSVLPTPDTIRTDDRIELKLTGQIHPKHNVVASYFDWTVNSENLCQFGCWEPSTMTKQFKVPNSMWTAQYNGIAATNVLVEANYSASDQSFHTYEGQHVTTDFSDPRDIALGTWGYDLNVGGMWGAPPFTAETIDLRDQEYFRLKATYFLATAHGGTHNIVAGYESFMSKRVSNNYQSGSNLMMYIYWMPPDRGADGTVYPVITGPEDSPYGFGDTITWAPIFETSRGERFATDSLFLNDKWDLGSHWSFNIGARLDRNDGRNSSGYVVADDQYLSPRFGVIYDVKGDGRVRLGASYSKYVSRISTTNSGPAASGGNPAYIDYEYRGPTIRGMTSFDALTEVFRWFLAQGGTDATDLVYAARFPGLTSVLDGTLDTPNVGEWTVGFGSQIGKSGFLRLDLIDREWADFLVEYNVPGDTVVNPYGFASDLNHNANLDGYERNYRAVQMQGSYRAGPHVNIGGNYTWSELKGNVGELWQSPFVYSEYKGFARHNPSGYLGADMRHKAALWVGYDQPLGAFGALNIALLERYESGRPYSAIGEVPVSSFVSNPGYLLPPSRVAYFFSDRGEYRWDDMTSTDLALNWRLPIRAVSFFVQGDILNVFDQQAQVQGNVPFVKVRRGFNPFTDTPVEGVDWTKPASFGAATQPADYQTPRTYRISAGVRF